MQRIHASEIVVGDVVLIQEGMNIPADGWLVQASDLRIDESHLTGENEASLKDTLERCSNAKIAGDSSPTDLANDHNSSPIILDGSQVMTFLACIG